MAITTRSGRAVAAVCAAGVSLILFVTGFQPGRRSIDDGRGVALAAGHATAAAGLRRWSDPAAWNGGLPKAGAYVHIPSGTTVLLDMSPPPLGILDIHGALVFEDKDLELTADSVVVHGRLQVGSAPQPFRSRAVITLSGKPVTAASSPFGTKALAVMGGTLELHGSPRRPSWTRLAKTARAGSSQLVVERPVDWMPGDLIVVASTDFQPLQAEEARIRAVAGGVVALDHPLVYTHWGDREVLAGVPVDERAEVGLLSRNILVQGDKDSARTAFGGHVVSMAGSSVQIEWAEFFRMGQKRQLGRYPVHFHLVGDAPGSYVKNSSIHHGYNRCLTIHGTNRVVVQANVAYDTIGHCYFLEDGVETGNLLEDNLGLVTKSAASGEELLPSDAQPATFWVSHPQNAFRGNVAAGSQGFGFWFLLAEHPTGPSKTDKRDREVWPRRTPLGVFHGNVAHSNDDTGLFIDTDRADDDFAYTPHRNPIPPAEGQEDSAVVPAAFTDFTAYKNRQRGLWLRGENLLVRRAKLADNAIGATLASTDSLVEDALVVGETSNKGTPEDGQAVGAGGRSLPMPDQPAFPIRGFEFFWERVGVRNVTFVNFRPNSQRQASGLGYLVDNPYGINVRNFAEAARFIDANRVYLVKPNPKTDGDKSAVFYDKDGSVSGVAGGYVVANNPFMLTAACTKRGPWNAHVCTNTYGRLSFSTMFEKPTKIAPLVVHRDDNGAENALAGIGGNENEPTSVFQTSVIFGKTYRAWWSGPEPPHLNVSVEFAGPGQWVRLALRTRTTTFKIYRNGDESAPLARAASLQELDASAGDRYYVDGRFVYVKLAAQADEDGASLDIYR